MRAMLAEHGIDLPSAEDEQSEYRTLLLAFGYWDLPTHFFEGPFYVQIPTWEDKARSTALSSSSWTSATT